MPYLNISNFSRVAACGQDGGRRTHPARTFALGAALLLLFFCLSRTGHAQVCCAAGPTGENTSSAGGDPNAQYATETDYYQTLTGGSGNYVGWYIWEYAAQSGSDGCYQNTNLNQALVPPDPQPSNNTNDPWTVTAGNVWGVDIVGWAPGSVSYIRQNSPMYAVSPMIPNFPCGATAYQALSAECPGGTTAALYDPDVVQSEAVYSTDVYNTREGVPDTIYQ
jgi:hypothetical protein